MEIFPSGINFVSPFAKITDHFIGNTSETGSKGGRQQGTGKVKTEQQNDLAPLIAQGLELPLSGESAEWSVYQGKRQAFPGYKAVTSGESLLNPAYPDFEAGQLFLFILFMNLCTGAPGKELWIGWNILHQPEHFNCRVQDQGGSFDFHSKNIVFEYHGGLQA
jgi:hypothetical protein